MIHNIETMEAKIREEVKKWRIEQHKKSVFVAFYAYYKIGDFVISDNPPKGYSLATPERISPGWDENGTFNKLRFLARKLPLLAVKD